MKVPETPAQPGLEQPAPSGTRAKQGGAKFARLLKAAPPQGDPPEAPPGGKEPRRESARFSGSGMKRRPEKPLEPGGKRRASAMKPYDEAGASSALPAQGQTPPDNALAAREIGRPQEAAGAAQLDSLVREIAVSVQDRSTSVDIQLNSRTFDGLQIRLTAAPGDAVAIQFLTASPQVHEFLEANIDSLSAALERRNIRVSGVRVSKRESGEAGKSGATARGKAR